MNNLTTKREKKRITWFFSKKKKHSKVMEKRLNYEFRVRVWGWWKMNNKKNMEFSLEKPDFFLRKKNQSEIQTRKWMCGFTEQQQQQQKKEQTRFYDKEIRLGFNDENVFFIWW